MTFAEDGRTTGEDELVRVHDVRVFYPGEEGCSSCGLVGHHLAAHLLEELKPRSSEPVLLAAPAAIRRELLCEDLD